MQFNLNENGTDAKGNYLWVGIKIGKEEKSLFGFIIL